MALVNDTNEFEGSTKDSGKTQIKLIQHFNIPNKTNITIFNLDFRKNDSAINNVK